MNKPARLGGSVALPGSASAGSASAGSASAGSAGILPASTYVATQQQTRCLRSQRITRSFLLLLALCLCSAAVSAQTPQATPPPPTAPRSVQFPKPVEKTLANGLRVIVIDRPGTPLVTAQPVIKNGGEVDPPELAGLGNMLADLVTKGTEKRSATQIAEAVEALGGSLYSSARWDSTRIGVDVMSSKIGPAVEILADVVRRPTFKEEEIERLRQQTLDDITVELGEPGSIARYVAARVGFRDAPYGQPLAGTTETITRISRSDFVKYHGAVVSARQRDPGFWRRHSQQDCVRPGPTTFWRL